MLFVVYRCVQWNRWPVGVFNIGGRGERCVSSTLCRYDIMMRLLLVRCVSLGRESSEGGILGAC